MINYKEEQQKLVEICEVAKTSCIDMQNELTGLRYRLHNIRNDAPAGCAYEIDMTTSALQKAEMLLGYIRMELGDAQKCFGMRNERGEVE